MSEKHAVPRKRPAFEPAARLLQPSGYDPTMRRPISTVAGAALVMLRVIAGILWAIALSQGTRMPLLDVLLPEASTAVEASLIPYVVGVVIVYYAIEAVLGVLIFLGHNWPRVLVMIFSVLAISSAFAGWWANGQEITLSTSTSIIALGLDILVLLALSSRSASAYARRNQRH